MDLRVKEGSGASPKLSFSRWGLRHKIPWKEAAAYYATGLTLREVGKIYGVSCMTISRIFKRRNIIINGYNRAKYIQSRRNTRGTGANGPSPITNHDRVLESDPKGDERET